MDKDKDLTVDFDVLRHISARSLENGTSADVLESTLVRIGLSKSEAKNIVKQARAEVKKKGKAR